MWYFSGQGSDDSDKKGTVSIFLGMKWSLWYHLGSLAWGSFLVAVITMIRIVFEFFAAKLERLGGSENPFSKCALCTARCCLWCLDKCVKFINKNAYIQVALLSKSFCASAWVAFYLMVRHVGRFTMSTIASTLVALFGKGAIIGLCVWISILLTQRMHPDVDSPVLPAVVVGLFAYLIATMFLQLFTFSVLAILHCFNLDEESGGSRQTPDSLKDFFEGVETTDSNAVAPVNMMS